MKNLFLPNSDMTDHDIKDKIHQKLTQVRCITSCLLLANDDLSNAVRYGVIWAMDSLLEDLDILCEAVK